MLKKKTDKLFLRY